MMLTSYRPEFTKETIIKSMTYVAQKAVELRPSAFAGIRSADGFSIWYLDSNGKVLEKVKNLTYVDEVKISPDGTMTAVIRKEASARGQAVQAQLVITSKTQVLASVSLENVSSLGWCGRELIVGDGKSIRAYSAFSGDWRMRDYGQAESGVKVDGFQYWKVDKGRLWQMISDVPVYSVPIQGKSPILLDSSPKAPFAAHVDSLDEKSQPLRTTLFLDNLRTGQQLQLTDKLFLDQAVFLQNPDRLLYFECSGSTYGKLMERNLPDGAERSIGYELRCPQICKLNDDLVLISDQGDRQRKDDGVYLFRVSTRRMTKLDGLGLRSGIQIGSCRVVGT